MSTCDGCGHDDIYGSRRERREQHTLAWLCPACRREMLKLPPLPVPERHWVMLPVAGIISFTMIVVSIVLAVGAHW